MRNFETFRTEEELLKRIEQLKSLGIKESEIHILSAKPLNNPLFNYSDLKVDSPEVTLGDKISAFFTGEDPEERAFDRFNFNDEVRGSAVTSVRNGYYVLVVDKDEYYSDDRYLDGRSEFVDSDLRDREGLDMNEKIRLHEERLRVDKDRVKTGEVGIKKDVVTEHQEVRVPVEKEEVVIERRKVDEKAANNFDSTIDEQGTIRIPVTEERVKVEKENVVTEEILVKKNVVHDTETVGADLRKETVEIDKDLDKNRNR